MTVVPATPEPFASLLALRAAHTEILKRHRAEGESLALVQAVEAFLASSCATGALLAEEDERWTAQSLLDYWSTTLYRAGTSVPITALAEFDPSLAPALPDIVCPYLGLDAFSEQSTELFFGRRKVITDMLARLGQQRLLTIVGPSGSGKSSLLRAGLLPALKAGGLVDSTNWRYLPPIVPGSDPLAALDRVLEEVDLASREPLLVLIDQFEESFTLCTDEAKRTSFIERLVALASDPGPAHRVVLTMRSDFEPFVVRAEDLRPLFEAGKLAVPPLSASELREAIEQPAARVGLKFEAGLVDALLQDILGEPAALPLLQFTLLKLWERRERNRVTLAAYRQVGGGRLALARSADALYTSLIPEEQVTARRILLRMVRPGEGLEVTSNRVRRADLDRGGEDPGRVARVVKKLVVARLVRLTPGERDDDIQVEVAHEALVRNWPTLVEWLEDERLSLRQRQRLSAAAEQWQRLGRVPSALLRGTLLEEAQHYDDLNKLEQEFVSAGVVAEKAQYRRTVRTNWLIRGLLVITTVASIVATTLALQANDGRTRAEQSATEAQIARIDAEQARSTSETSSQITSQQRAIAVAAQATAESAQNETEQQRDVINTQRLAFAAQSLMNTKPETALLLAYEAAARNENLVTEQTLRNAIDTVPWRPLPLSIHSDSVVSTVFSPNGSRILTASADGTARLWGIDGAMLTTFKGHIGSVVSAVFSPDGSLILTASADQTARLWTMDGTSLTTFDEHAGSVVSALFNRDGSLILTTSFDGTARLWRTDGTLLAILDEHTGPVLSAVFSPDGSRILTASTDKTARLWATDGIMLKVFSGHEGQIYHVTFSSDGSRILTASRDGTARLWSVEGRELRVLRGHADLVWSAEFSPDDSRILTASRDGTARLWAADGAPFNTLRGHSESVTHASFSKDGSRILTASDDGTARLWTADGAPLEILSGHTKKISSAEFSPDGTYILTGSFDKTARLWEEDSRLLARFPDRGLARSLLRQDSIPTKDLLSQGACLVGRGLTDSEITQFNVPMPLRFDFAARQCPPRFSWE